MKLKSSALITIGTGLAGIIIAVLVYFVQQEIINTYNTYLPYISLGDNIKNKTTKGHLWFEEYMSGDESIDLQKDVLGLFNNSVQTLSGALSGQETELGIFEDLNDKQVSSLLTESIDELNYLIAFTNKRDQFKTESEKKMLASLSDSTATAGVLSTGEEAGGEMDQQFDEAYEGLQASLDKLVNYINSKTDVEINHVQNMALVAIIVIVAIFLALCVLIFRIQQKNESASAVSQKKLQTEVERIEKMTDFVDSISSGNFDINLELDTENDRLGNTLIKMKNNLEQVSSEDKKRNWSVAGQAKFGDLLRDNQEEVKVLGDKVISELVKYMEANQGSLYLVNDDESEEYLELISCYAWGRKKFIEDKIKKGQGLAGQAWQEGSAIFLTDIPKDYVKITSGLGEATPTCILIQPLLVNEKIYGVIELASFKTWAEHELEFLSKIAESIGSTVSGVRITQRTKTLLEQSQQQTEEMRAQEEEMRQNQEELQATQEEMERQKAELEEEIAVLKKTKG
jgi:hypothetical protein